MLTPATLVVFVNRYVRIVYICGVDSYWSMIITLLQPRSTKSTEIGNFSLTAWRFFESVLTYFDISVLLAGVQFEYNHKQTVYGTSRITYILYDADT